MQIKRTWWALASKAANHCNFIFFVLAIVDQANSRYAELSLLTVITAITSVLPKVRMKWVEVLSMGYFSP